MADEKDKPASIAGQNQAKKPNGFDTRFKPGQSGNPNGKPVGTRQKVESDFWKALADDFSKRGPEAVAECRVKDPVAYFRTVASLMPKQIEITRPMDGMSDDDIRSAVETLQSYIAAQGNAGRAPTESPGESTGGISTLQ